MADDYLVPKSGTGLSKRSDALVLRGLRDLEADERLQGNAEYKMGYECECGVDRNLAAAIIHYRKAAELGHLMAQVVLCQKYECGADVAQDLQEAGRWFARIRELAESGNREAQTTCSVLYKYGWGVEQNPAESARWALRATEDGPTPRRAESETWLAFLYRDGYGLLQDVDAEESCLRKALTYCQEDETLRRGNILHDLGEIYSGEVGSSSEVRSSKKNLVTAYACFKLSADTYDLEAQTATRGERRALCLEKASTNRAKGQLLLAHMSASQITDAEELVKNTEWLEL